VQLHLQIVKVKAVYQGRQVKVKVTGTKKCVCILSAGGLPEIKRGVVLEYWRCFLHAISELLVQQGHLSGCEFSGNFQKY